MKPSDEMTLLEINHLILVHGKDFLKPDELGSVSAAIGLIRFYSATLVQSIKLYKPEHTCPQCSTPKKEKEPEINFHLTDS